MIGSGACSPSSHPANARGDTPQRRAAAACVKPNLCRAATSRAASGSVVSISFYYTDSGCNLAEKIPMRFFARLHSVSVSIGKT